MKEAAGSEAGNVTVELELVAEVVSQQLESMLSVGNYDAVKLLLKPVQPVDIAEAIGNLPTNLQALAFRFLGKDEAISVYEYLDSATQQSLLRRFRLVTKQLGSNPALLRAELTQKLTDHLGGQLLQ